jgi:hypothetical protein
MKVINQYIVFVYVVLISAIVVLIGDLLIHLIKMMKTTVNDTVAKINNVSDGIKKMSDTAGSIKDSGDGWSFFLSASAIYIILKETLKYAVSEKSLSKSFAKACIRHSGSIKKIKI